MNGWRKQRKEKSQNKSVDENTYVAPCMLAILWKTKWAKYSKHNGLSEIAIVFYNNEFC